MKIYIDLEHYISFLSRESDEHYMNCVHMLQCDLDIHFTFAKDELLKLKKDIKAKKEKQNEEKAKYETEDAVIKAVCENSKFMIY